MSSLRIAMRCGFWQLAAAAVTPQLKYDDPASLKRFGCKLTCNHVSLAQWPRERNGDRRALSTQLWDAATEPNTQSKVHGLC
eukprot:CAMPEP_0171097558 /NCGR_PEP_ID=MMETSP0766_2-20121228/47616_1 /TAXON_ID=439317 /ORGANISM="Gambierdiscus australes, Strain CAWD 149" /LENGTH=81 /DNA_ID=CAMNT_0011556773 /DNA_START=99 /DNA_END=342 /DNA_ORIENTATION=-